MSDISLEDVERLVNVGYCWSFLKYYRRKGSPKKIGKIKREGKALKPSFYQQYYFTYLIRSYSRSKSLERKKKKDRKIKDHKKIRSRSRSRQSDDSKRLRKDRPKREKVHRSSAKRESKYSKSREPHPEEPHHQPPPQNHKPNNSGLHFRFIFATASLGLFRALV